MSLPKATFKTDAGSADGLISIREAADLTSYTTAHLSRLARQGEVRAVKSGRQWFIDPVSLQEFKQDTELRKHERRRKLSDERVAALHGDGRRSKKGNTAASVADKASVFNVKTLLESGIVMVSVALLVILIGAASDMMADLGAGISSAEGEAQPALAIQALATVEAWISGFGEVWGVR